MVPVGRLQLSPRGLIRQPPQTISTCGSNTAVSGQSREEKDRGCLKEGSKVLPL